MEMEAYIMSNVLIYTFINIAIYNSLKQTNNLSCKIQNKDMFTIYIYMYYIYDIYDIYV